jgi:hypothetical protein
MGTQWPLSADSLIYSWENKLWKDDGTLQDKLGSNRFKYYQFAAAAGHPAHPALLDSQADAAFSAAGLLPPFLDADVEAYPSAYQPLPLS